MKIEFLANFDFEKLSKKWSNSIKPKLYESISKDTAAQWKKNIKKGNFTPIKASTKELRKGSGSKPLTDTWSLYRSIVVKKDSIQHLAYGEHHIDGYITGRESMIPNKRVPARRWKGDMVNVAITEKTEKKIFKEIGSGLRRAGRGKIIGKL